MAAKKHTAVQREKLISEYNASGQTQSEWCNRNGIGKSTLGKWLKETENEQEAERNRVAVIKNGKGPLKAAKSQQKWVETQISQVADCSKTIKVKIGSFTVAVEREFDKETLIAVITVLQKLC